MPRATQAKDGMTKITGSVPAEVWEWVEAEASARFLGSDAILTEALRAFSATIPGGPQAPMKSAPKSAPATANGGKKAAEPVTA